MSVSLAESALKRVRSDLERARKKQADEEKKASAAETAASDKRRNASRSSNDSSVRSYLRDAERKGDDANRARSAAAAASGKVADLQKKVHDAEVALDRARAAERKKADDKADRERKKRDDEDRRARERAERASQDAERERERADAARDAQIKRMTHDVATTRAVIDSRPWDNAPEQITVLVLTAEPDGEDRLRIDRELREIQQQVRSSELRDSINFEYRHAARFGDLIQHLNETEPDVIHFSGHGSSNGLALHAADDSTRELTNEQLDQLLSVAPKPLKLVVFNSCNSADQARVAVRHAAAAIGTQAPIGDEAARVFAGQLYNSLGFGRSLGLAVRQALLYVEMQLDATSGEPTLLLAHAVDADELIIVNPSPCAGLDDLPCGQSGGLPLCQRL